MSLLSPSLRVQEYTEISYDTNTNVSREEKRKKIQGDRRKKLPRWTKSPGLIFVVADE